MSNAGKGPRAYRPWIVWSTLTGALAAGALLSALLSPDGPRTSSSNKGVQLKPSARVLPEKRPSLTPVPAALRPRPPANDFTHSPQQTPPGHVSPPSAEVAREHWVPLPSLRERVLAAAAEAKPLHLVLPLPGGRALAITSSRHDAWQHRGGAAHGGVVVGAVDGVAGSYAVLGYSGDDTAGVVFAPGLGLYRVRATGVGLHRVAELDPARIPQCPGAVVPPVEPPTGASAVHGRSTAAQSLAMHSGAPGESRMPALVDELSEADAVATDPGAPATSADAPVAQDGETTVDLLVAYTPAAAAANGGTSGITALINASIATANLAFSNSGAGILLRLVLATQQSYTETHALATDLGALRGTSDGQLDGVHALRDQYKADLVSLVVTGASDAAGIGYLWTPGGSASFASYGFNVVVDAYADANLTLAHEVGHNFGCGHAVGDGGSGAYSYSNGNRFTASATQYRTVMAYSPGTRVPYFSSPTVSYLGTATGTSSANNALGLTQSKGSVSSLRMGLTASEQLWTPVAAGDFNADGQTDLVWRNSSTGRVIVWFMSGTTRVSTATLWSGDAAWVPITAGDFNADGKPDLVWRNSGTGRVIVWLMDGVTMTSTATLWSGTPAWVPVAAGDLNGDGKPDLVWRNSQDGRVVAWLMNGTTMSSATVIWSSDANWHPVAMGDLSGDGKADIVWRNASSGRVIAWFMNGVASTGTATLWSGTSAWVPRTAGQLGGDAGADLVWRNSLDGRVVVWTMSGTTAASTTMIWQ